MPDDRSRATHDAHNDARNEYAARRRVEAVKALEDHVRQATRTRLLTPLVQEPAHEFRTPIVDRFDRSVIKDHMLAPGSTDDTGFSDGRV